MKVIRNPRPETESLTSGGADGREERLHRVGDTEINVNRNYPFVVKTETLKTAENKYPAFYGPFAFRFSHLIPGRFEQVIGWKEDQSRLWEDQ